MNDIALFRNWDVLTPQRRRQKIEELQIALLNLAETHPEVEIPVTETLCNGLYMRNMPIPADTIIVGELHSHDQINMLVKGTIIVATENACVELTAPQTLIASSGTKKAAYAVTDCEWVELFSTNKTDPAEIKQEIIAESYAALEDNT